MKFLSESIIFLNKTPVRRNLTYGYISGIVTYNIATTYIDCKIGLHKYKTLKESGLKSSCSIYSYEYLLHKCENKWDAAKFAASYSLYERFFDSMIWPLKVASNIVPFVVLFFDKDV